MSDLMNVSSTASGHLLSMRKSDSNKTHVEDVAVLTGGFDRPYAFGLTMALASKGIAVDVLGGGEIDSPEMHATPNVRFHDIYGDPRRERSGWAKLRRVLAYYLRLIGYARQSRAKIFHLLWNNKFQAFDRTLLTLYYKLCGRKLAFTAHNVNAGKRDGNDSILNRLTLKAQYQLVDHIFVHTEPMKKELQSEFSIPESKVTVIPFGINNSVPDTDLTSGQAKARLGISRHEKAILFFGAIRPYKGLQYLAEAFKQLSKTGQNYRLIIAGEPKKGTEQYLSEIRLTLDSDGVRDYVIDRTEFIADEETELYFKAADVTVLPYTSVFQSGVLFLAYSFGLPVIASDVACFREDIIEGCTGFVFTPCSADDLAKSLKKYFESDLYKNLEHRRREIREYAQRRNSWNVVAEVTQKVYAALLA
jgi:glycosyltransferase involved in cell wall biosynthesis